MSNEKKSLSKVCLDRNSAREFYQKVSSDDSFRKELQTNPVEVLARYGIEVSPDQIPNGIKIPDKNEFPPLPGPQEKSPAFIAFIAFIAFLEQ